MKEVVLFVLTTITVIVGQEITIQTNLGQIRGLVIQNGTQKVHQFFKIPFAKPPVGGLRFKKPEPYGAFNGVLDGTKPSPACMQNMLQNVQGTEDCLYLNIFVPNDISVTNNKSVMIWIHGGAFVTGTGGSFDGSELATSGDVIVVTINYRLNIFGFISTGDSNLPGNYGLWDQRLAIQWVKNNIREYGGNPSSITIFGESAGATSVGFHSLNPLNTGLFQRAILQSGSPSSKKLAAESGNFDLFAKHAGCDSKDTMNAIQCLQQKSALYLMDVYVNASMQSTSIKPILGCIVDGDIIPAKPETLLRDKTSLSYKFFRSLDIIVGSVSVEGTVLLLSLGRKGIDISKGLTTTLLCNVLSPAISAEFFQHISTVSKAICDRYKVSNGDTSMMSEQGRQLLNMYGDLLFLSPAVELLQIHSKDNLLRKTYQFLLSHDLDRIFPTPDWVQGAHHGSISAFLFKFKQIAASKTLSIEEYNLAEAMLKYWTNFAKTGNPNDASSIVPDWPVYNASKGNYIQLDTSIQTKSRLFDERVRFWNVDIPQIINPVVQSNSGQIKGIAVQSGSSVVTEFRSIPYAQPPIGKLRFSRPRPVQAWSGVYEALRFPPSCIQKTNPSQIQFLQNKTFSEDCLYLNLYVPGKVSSVNKKSVMIFIHGGGYINGQASLYYGPFLAGKGDVILAILNYRLGVFGFISSNDSVLKGNYGLWDQKLAIEWIKANIGHFGGDASSITIFGESAGAFSVCLQALSPLNKNLFRRVIAQSGTSLVEMAVSKSPPNLVLLYSNLLNCTNSSTLNMVECLREKSSAELQDVYDKMVIEYWKMNAYHPAYPDIALKPTVDGELIPDEPFNLLSDTSSESYKLFRSLDFIVGTTNMEGSLLVEVLNMLNIDTTNGISTDVLCDVLSPGFAYGKKYNLNVTSQKICDQYAVKDGNTSELVEQGKQIFNMYGDDLFVSPAIALLNMHANQNQLRSSYQYLFSKQLPRSLELFPLPKWLEGSAHASELFYMFTGYELSSLLLGMSWTEEEKRFVDALILYWSNFAKTGTPNGKDLPNWPKYTNKEKEYLEFGSNNSLKSMKMLWPNRMKFWFDLKGLDYVMKERITTKPIGIATKPQPFLGLCFILTAVVWFY